MAHRRLSFDCKSRPVFSHQTGIGSQTRSSDDMEKVKVEVVVIIANGNSYLKPF